MNKSVNNFSRGLGLTQSIDYYEVPLLSGQEREQEKRAPSPHNGGNARCSHGGDDRLQCPDVNVGCQEKAVQERRVE